VWRFNHGWVWVSTVLSWTLGKCLPYCLLLKFPVGSICRNICVSSDFSIFPGLEGGGLQNLFAQESQNNGGNPCSQVRERREPNSTTPVHPEEPSKNLAKYIVPPYSPTYAGIPSLFSPVHPFSPQCSSPYNNSRFNWQVGNSESVLSAHHSFLQEVVSSIEQGAILSTNPQAPILPGNGGLYQEKAGDRDHSHDGVISNLSPGDDESSESVEFSKEDLHHPTHWRGNTGKQRHSEREKRRRHKGNSSYIPSTFCWLFEMQSCFVWKWRYKDLLVEWWLSQATEPSLILAEVCHSLKWFGLKLDSLASWIPWDLSYLVLNCNF